MKVWSVMSKKPKDRDQEQVQEKNQDL